MSEPRAHASKRAKERFGVTLNSRRRQQIRYQILSGKAELLTPGRLRSIYLCWLSDGRRVRVVFDHRFSNLVTVLPTPTHTAKEGEK